MLTKFPRLPAALFLVGRLLLLISFSQDGLRGFGDFAHFYNLAGLGIPFFEIWVEFPPFFPYLSRLLYVLAGSRQHVYDYALALLLACAQAAVIVVFYRLALRAWSEPDSRQRTWIFTALLLALPYGWWYFDPLAVLWMLLGFYWVLNGRGGWGGSLLGLGILTKLFPILVLPAVWKIRPKKTAVLATLAALAVTFVVYIALYLGSPEFTRASVISQSSKGSWETVWALIDGNFRTGNFGPEVERYDPALASRQTGNPPRWSPWLALIPFAALGVALMMRGKSQSDLSPPAWVGVTWCLFLLWTPGYSPQWLLYVLPWVILVLPVNEAVLMAVALALVHILEWPVMLSRGLFWGLWVTIPLRTLLWIILLVMFYRASQGSTQGRLNPESN